MLFVWITSYLFVLIVGGVLSLTILFKFFVHNPARDLKKLAETENPTDFEPLSEPSIPPSGPILI